MLLPIFSRISSRVMKNRYVLIPILINIAILLILLAVVIASGASYQNMLLRADSYYTIADEFAHGGSLLHKFRGPVLPLVFSMLFIFPYGMHPFIRLLLSIIVSAGTITVLYNLTKKYITGREFLFGSLIFIFNPVYVHWTFRPFPEIYLALVLGIFIFSVIRYYRESHIGYLCIAVLSFILSFFIKPVFVFIPFFLLFAALLIKSKKIAAVSVLLLILGILTYVAQDEFTKVGYEADASRIDKTYEYAHKTLLISESYWVDYVVRTRQLFKPTLEEYQIEYKDGKSFQEYAQDWFRDFYQKYPKANYISMNLYFIYKEPFLFLQKLILSPFFFFSMSARTSETIMKLAVSILSVILAIIGLNAALRMSKYKKEIILIVFVLIGYASLHLVTHAMNRYSLPILPYLYVWGGIPLVKSIDWVLSFVKKHP